MTYVNHTSTTPLALSASLHPYAGLERHELCEVPTEASPLAAGLTLESLPIDASGRLHVPDRPGSAGGRGRERDHRAQGTAGRTAGVFVHSAAR